MATSSSSASGGTSLFGSLVCGIGGEDDAGPTVGLTVRRLLLDSSSSAWRSELPSDPPTDLGTDIGTSS